MKYMTIKIYYSNKLNNYDNILLDQLMQEYPNFHHILIHFLITQ